MRTVVLGGGLAGIAAAYAIARANVGPVTLVERGPALGGLAGGFVIDEHWYPLGYHHILHRDRPLHFFLDRIGAVDRVRWRRIRMLFEGSDGRLWNLADPIDFARFPLRWPSKVRFARLMLRAFSHRNWSAFQERSAADLIDAWGDSDVRQSLFEPLTQLKFQLPTSQISAAWLGARLSYREGASPLGYIPHTTWTQVLCDGLTQLVADAGVEVLTNTAVSRLETQGGRVTAVQLADGHTLKADKVVSAVPTEVYLDLVADRTPSLQSIRYTALVSAVCATTQRVPEDFYWLNLSSLRHTAAGLFVLSSLNPTLGAPGETCLNFVTHLQRRDDPLFTMDEHELWQKFDLDFEALFGTRLARRWSHVSRVPLYSPVFGRDYTEPPLRSHTWENVFFAGNYRTFPSVASTGTALISGLQGAQAVLQSLGRDTSLPREAGAYRLRHKPRGGDDE
jgi:protoporphyrinogen oxidase